MAMSEMYQKLILLELAPLGFSQAAYDSGTGRIVVQPGNENTFLITDNGDVMYTEDSGFAWKTLWPLAKRVKEAADAWDRAHPLTVGDLPEYRVMAEYNNTVLAARDDTGLGYGLHFVTWEYNYERTGMYHGNYTTDYASAKQDFAVRSGLIPKNMVFEPEQAAALKEAAGYRLENDDEMLPQAYDILKEAALKLDATYPAPAAAPVREAELEQISGIELGM